MNTSAQSKAETMSKAEIYYMAFQSLSEEEQAAVVRRLLENESLREDILDIALMRQRKNEPSRPLRDYFAVREKRSR